MRLRSTALSILVMAAVLAASTAGAKPPKRLTPGQRATVAKKRSLLNRNIIPNGDAEIFEDRYASGWEPREILESENYDQTHDGSSKEEVREPGAGERYFRLPVPQGEERISVEQWVSIEKDSTVIDAGLIYCKLSGRIGGLFEGPGSSVLSATFRNGVGQPIAKATIGPVRKADLPSASPGSPSLLEQSAEGRVPAGTRRIQVTLLAVNTEFAKCPTCSALGLADQLSLVLSRTRPKRQEPVEHDEHL